MSRLSDLTNLNLSESTQKVIAEYIWIGGSGMDLRSKARTLPGPVSDPSKLPKWNYDGSSTGQAPGDDSEVILYPRAIFRDPFRKGNNILVICDAYTPAGEPIPTNKRHSAAKIFSHPDVVAEEPCYGIEQEYTLLQKDVIWPLGWPIGGFPGPQGPYYGGAGADVAFGRDVVDSHYKACLYAGINISGTNGEVMSSQWAFHVGPAPAVSAGDQLWCARYILERICEIYGVAVSFDPKPIPGVAEKHGMVVCDPNMIPNQSYNLGDGTHMLFSTESMRNPKGYEAANKAAYRLNVMGALSGLRGNEFKVRPSYDASANTDDGKAKPRGFVVDVIKMPSFYEVDPYTIAAAVAETAIQRDPTYREMFVAKCHTDPFLRAVRSAYNALKQFVTCSSSFLGRKISPSS